MQLKVPFVLRVKIKKKKKEKAVLGSNADEQCVENPRPLEFLWAIM